MPKVYDVTVNACTALLLLLAAAAKLSAATHDRAMFRLNDPILLINNSTLFYAVGLVEISIALFLLLSRNNSLKLWAHAWLVACFSLYRVGWWLSDIKQPCPCLGTGVEWWPWFNLHLDSIAIFFFVALIVLLIARSIPVFAPRISLRREPAGAKII